MNESDVEQLAREVMGGTCDGCGHHESWHWHLVRIGEYGPCHHYAIGAELSCQCSMFRERDDGK